MLDVGYLFVILAISCAVMFVVIYLDYLKFQKWMQQQPEAEPFKYEEPVRISKRQAELFNRSMRRIRRELKK